jgi:methylated-DNA-[protein]-cysteine S-methyltransferase
MKSKNQFLVPKDVSEADFTEMVASPIGTFAIIASEVGIRFIKPVDKFIPNTKPNHHTNTAASQLEMYFTGKSRQFDIKYDLSGHSAFSIRVWQELMKIPFGQTISYAQLASRLGDPLCIRAAASANGRNPIPIIIPCHRVIGSDGSLTGFALGLDVKKNLLSLENPAKYAVIQTTLF